MTKARERAKKQKDDNAAKGLIDALAFVSLAQSPKSDNPMHSHCFMSEGVLTATDGVLTVGTSIQETVNACPHTVKLRQALSMCGANLQLTSDDVSLTVKSGHFSRAIQCMRTEDYYRHYPDPKLIDVCDNFRFAIESVAVLASDSHEHLICATVHLLGQSAMATNRHVILEVWHGYNIPIEINMPKGLVTALSKVKKKLVGFGASDSSATFWFEDGSYLKGQLVNYRWPSVDSVLNVETNPWPLPEDFFTAIEATCVVDEQFSRVDFKGDRVESSDGSAVFEIEGAPEDISFNGKYILMMRPFMDRVDFKGNQRGLIFYSDVARGSIARMQECSSTK